MSRTTRAGVRATKTELVLDETTTQDAFDSWYHTYAPNLKAWCGRFLGDDAAAQDVVQETLLRAWTRRDTFADPAQVAPWLWRVARNLCLDNMRRRKKLVFSDSLPEAPDYRADPTLGVEIEQERAAVREALGELSDRHQEVLMLRDVRGLDYEELANRLGVTPNGARAVLFRARRSLRNALSSSEAFGAFVPVGVFRKVWETIHKAGSVVGARASSRPSLAMEVAAATLAAATVLGPVGASDPVTAPTPIVVDAAVTDALPVGDLAGLLASAERALLDAAAAKAPVADVVAAEAAEVADAELPTDGWQASLTIGQRRGEPGTALVELSLGYETAEATGPVSALLGEVTGALPPLDLDLLQRAPSSAPTPPAPGE